MNTARDGLRTVDHLMPHISTVPADKGERVKIFVREKGSRGGTHRPGQPGQSPGVNELAGFSHGSRASAPRILDQRRGAGITEIAKLEPLTENQFHL